MKTKTKPISRRVQPERVSWPDFHLWRDTALIFRMSNANSSLLYLRHYLGRLDWREGVTKHQQTYRGFIAAAR